MNIKLFTAFMSTVLASSDGYYQVLLAHKVTTLGFVLGD